MAQATEISPIVGVGQENFSFEVSDFHSVYKTKKINFEPNIAGIIRVGANAYGFGLGYSIRGSNKDLNSRFGKTDFSDWQLGYNSKNWGVESYYQTYTGFHTKNTLSTQVFEDLKFKHIGFLARYSFGDEEFSVGALMDQSSEVTHSSGKYYVIFGYHEHFMETLEPLLQMENSGTNANLENLRKLNSQAVKYGFGAGKYWLFSDVLFIGGMIDILGTYANYKFEDSSGNISRDYDTTASSNIRLAAGYKESNFRIGLSLGMDSTTLKTNSSGFIRPSANKLLVYLRLKTDF